MTLIEREHARFLQTYKRLPVEIDRAEGMYVHTADGTRYLDFLGGIAVNSLGHTHPRIVAAVELQLRRYMHISNYFYQDTQVEFVERLLAMSGYDRAFLANSGSEVTEGSLKLARAFGHEQGKTEIIGFTGGFHGRTYGALSIMHKPRYKDGMGPFLPDAKVLPFNDVEALRASVSERTCSVTLEFLQGEGGIRWATPEFVAALFELRERYGFLVIGDEIQSGGGRTGDFFAFTRHGIRPDIVVLAKGIGGGLPLAAILTTERLANIWGSGQHGTTFGGNALACAAGSVVLDVLKEGMMDHARQSGELLLARMSNLQNEFPDLVADVRGAGAIIGVELTIPAAPIVEALLRRRVIVNSTDETVIRLLPPLIYGEEHIMELEAAMKECLMEVRAVASR